MANSGTVSYSFNAGVSGFYSGIFSDTMQVFDTAASGVAGFTDLTQGLTILVTPNTVFDTYGLTTPVGPVTGRAEVTFGVGFPTSAGTLTPLLSPQDINNSTFSASPVPEPASLTLLTAGLLSLRQIRRRSR